MNKVHLIGNVTKDVSASETPSGVALCKFSIAVNRDYKTENGEKITDFFNVVTWRGQAEVCGKFLKKGSKVAIIGSLQNRSYEDRDGNKRTVTEIVANEVEFLSVANSTSENKNGSERQITASQIVLEEVDDDDLPF